MNGDEFMDLLFEEAARLFGVRVGHLFIGDEAYRDAWVREAEWAIAYTLWIVQSVEALRKRLHREVQVGALISRCVRRRVSDAKYDALVGDLVWFAMSGVRVAA